MKITINGPAASGKGTVSRMLAGKLGYVHFDAGMVFRFYALMSINYGIENCREFLVEQLWEKWSYEWSAKGGSIICEGRDVSAELHEQHIASLTAQLAATPQDFVQMIAITERVLAEFTRVIVDGRSAGTVLLPGADRKFYLDAPAEIRAERRYQELIQRGITSSREQVIADLLSRDELDRNRRLDPLQIPEGAQVLQTGFSSATVICEAILSHL